MFSILQGISAWHRHQELCIAQQFARRQLHTPASNNSGVARNLRIGGLLTGHRQAELCKTALQPPCSKLAFRIM